jgi:hypothetical protein
MLLKQSVRIMALGFFFDCFMLVWHVSLLSLAENTKKRLSLVDSVSYHPFFVQSEVLSIDFSSPISGHLEVDS